MLKSEITHKLYLIQPILHVVRPMSVKDLKVGRPDTMKTHTLTLSQRASSMTPKIALVIRSQQSEDAKQYNYDHTHTVDQRCLRDALWWEVGR